MRAKICQDVAVAGLMRTVLSLRFRTVDGRGRSQRRFVIKPPTGHVYNLATNKHLKYENQDEVVSLA